MILVYRVIVLLITCLLLRSMFKERALTRQLTAALVLVPMLLRLLMLK